MLPPPTLSFTIPSVHDGLVLQCRVYHPTCLSQPDVSKITAWRKRAAIVAHPYAPLGGCYDDPVVDRIASTILKESYIVGTFNFRGAGGAPGRTSWQSKPEQNDYMSFIGFMVFYLHQIRSPAQDSENIEPAHEFHRLSPIPSQVTAPPKSDSGHSTEPSSEANPQPLLLLAGYSYGALITTSLPPILASVISPFQTPISGSPHEEIRRRARFLADQQNELMKEPFSTLLSDHKQIEAQSLPSAQGRGASANGGGDKELLVAVPNAEERLSVAYLLVSPLHGWVNSLATMSLFGSRKGSRRTIRDYGNSLPEYETKLTIDPTLALFGDDDVFVSVNKLRAWTQRLRSACERKGNPNNFMFREVPGAGHFWHDHEAAQILREEVKLFVSSL
ncbi:hypothetical protein OIDMADRAFT_103456 [Oidiodendron maius Zn]|uniref:AB hydrolase-1 domain-containing protein n=1 Tax=Oidiodendron maius (strain Zn) TaxID=913774 RepID=A0A0C3DJZ1_OIDMZ|nr:hypothetical protein OIDMADRAFT_103456 [Oidiodendron maius Zn]